MYQVSVNSIKKLKKSGLGDCNKCKVDFEVDDNVIRTTRKMYHENCLKRIE